MKQRLDVLLSERGLAPSRSRARILIMEGSVFVDGQREDKPGSTFDEASLITVKENALPFVSRGGLKIQKALFEFDIDISGRTVMDVGASTGGFTDCMLQQGAKRVYSIDVGYGQLDYKLRCDDRVVVMERTNIRNLPPQSLDPEPEFSSIDVAFISLKKVIPVVKNLLARENIGILALIKPQFEAGKDQVGKNGVVRDAKIHESVILEVAGFANEAGYGISGLSYSPIKGPKGNIEFLIYLTQEKDPRSVNSKEVSEVVNMAHSMLE